MSGELKPCPFCGGDASLARCGFGTGRVVYTICNSEGQYCQSHDAAIDAWNTPAPQAAPELSTASRPEAGGGIGAQSLANALAGFVPLNSAQWVEQHPELLAGPSFASGWEACRSHVLEELRALAARAAPWLALPVKGGE